VIDLLDHSVKKVNLRILNKFGQPEIHFAKGYFGVGELVREKGPVGTWSFERLPLKAFVDMNIDRGNDDTHQEEDVIVTTESKSLEEGQTCHFFFKISNLANH